MNMKMEEVTDTLWGMDQYSAQIIIRLFGSYPSMKMNMNMRMNMKMNMKMEEVTGTSWGMDQYPTCK